MLDAASIAAAFALTRRTRFVYVTTNGADGYPNTRVMFNMRKTRASAIARGAARLPDGFATYLNTNTSSLKTAEARHDPRACLYYANTASFHGLTLTGRLEEVSDATIKRALWLAAWDKYYAGGFDGGDYTVFHFVPEHGRIYQGLRVLEFDASLPLAEVALASTAS
jgi:general stress protein 26